MYHELCGIMSSDEVVLLSFLLHHRSICTGLPEPYLEAGWFWCTADTVLHAIHWNGSKQGRVFRKLKEQDYIETDQHRKRNTKGEPTGQPVRWVRINDAKIVEDLDAIAEEYWAAKLNE